MGSIDAGDAGYIGYAGMVRSDPVSVELYL